MVVAALSAMDGACGRVVAVAADSAHRFSKPVRDCINLIEGHGVERDVHAGRFVRHRYLARKHPDLPNARQVHLMASELFAKLALSGFTVAPGSDPTGRLTMTPGFAIAGAGHYAGDAKPTA
jgi:hypothetical protein